MLSINVFSLSDAGANGITAFSTKDGIISTVNNTPSVIPEPSAVILMALGLLAFAGRRYSLK